MKSRRNTRRSGPATAGCTPVSGQRCTTTNAPPLADESGEREANYAERWKRGGFGFLSAYNDLLISRDANETAADFVRGRIRNIVKDPKVAALLCPDNVIGCKRPCLDTGYFETYNRSNVELVDARTNPIERITPDGVVVKMLSQETGDTAQESSRKIALDCIVFATGFDAMTGAVLGVDIRGRGSRTLLEAWSAGPRTYLGLGTAGFPNLFLITGPGSPSVLTNMMVSIEQHVDWIADCLVHLRREKLAMIEATAEAEDAWVDHVNAVAGLTLYSTCNSWYLGKNIPENPRCSCRWSASRLCGEVRLGGRERLRRLRAALTRHESRSKPPLRHQEEPRGTASPRSTMWISWRWEDARSTPASDERWSPAWKAVWPNKLKAGSCVQCARAPYGSGRSRRARASS